MNGTFDLLRTLQQLDPFVGDMSLRGLFSVVNASKAVNVDNAKQTGQAILDSMVGMTVKDFYFRRKNQHQCPKKMRSYKSSHNFYFKD